MSGRGVAAVAYSSSPRGQARRATIYDVARQAGVSHQTVARFVCRKRVREETPRKVEAALGALNYRSNPLAKALANNRSYRIGAFVHVQAQWALQAIMGGVAEEAHTAGYILDLVAVDPEDSAGVTARGSAVTSI